VSPLVAQGFGELDKESLLIPVAIQTANVAAAAYQFIPVDVSAGPVTVTLPGTPTDYTRVGVKLVKAGAGTVTVAASGADTFNGDESSTVTLSLLNQGMVAQYEADAGVWWVQAADVPLSQLDGRYANLSGASFTGAVTAGVASPIYRSTISIDASQADHFRIQLLGNATIATPANPTDGQAIRFELVQDSTGGRTVTWGSGYDFGSGLPPTLTTVPVSRNMTGFVYSADLGRWMYAGQSPGFF
jgi:hypothetical protein